MDYLQLVDECLRKQDTACVHKGDFLPELLELGVRLVKVLDEHRLDQLLDDDGVLLPAAAQVARVGELVEARGFAPVAPLSLPLVQEQLVPPGLGPAFHHILHSLQCLRGPEERQFQLYKLTSKTLTKGVS